MKRVFIVEDEPSLQYFYRQAVIFNDMELLGIAKDGNEAVSMFKSFPEKPKVILMDYRLPIKNGIEVAKEILQIDDKVKIIFITADSSIKDQVLSIGAYSFMDKPFSIKKLVQEINNAFKASLVDA
ncbi:MAG: response regulator [Candidatus Lokiarchaeota archaeon]|nr:response regulator [Candidatus Lokiarchaeota archaeon]MBD3211251.1 response regulator [Candidatus Lokiarchaeota archaeon]